MVGSLDGRIRHRHPVHPGLHDHGGDIGAFGIVEIGRDLDDQRRSLCGIRHGAGPGVQHADQHVFQNFPPLHRPEPGGIGRRYIGHQIIDIGCDGLDTYLVVGRAVLRRLVLADIGPERAEPLGTFGDTSDKRAQSRPVKAQTVDDRLVFRQAEHPGLRIARLGQRRDRARLDKTEPGRQHGIRHLGPLVESGG